MEFPVISKVANQWTTFGLALVAASLGFGAGWVAHQASINPLLQLRSYVPSRMSIACTNDLAQAEAQCPGAARAIVADSPYKFHVDRRALACLLSAPSTQPQLSPNVHIVPPIDGMHEGVRIFSVRPGSLPARLGLKNGDTIRRINGVPLRSPNDVQTVYARARTAPYISVDLERNTPQGRTPMVLRYHISGGAI